LSESKEGIKVLVIGAFLQLFLGIIYVWSVFVLPISETWGWDVDAVKLTSSFMLCCFALALLLGGQLLMRFGASVVVLAGGLMMSAGMLVTSFISGAPTWVIYITYGIVAGLGAGLAYTTILTCIQKWFSKKRGLATGIVVCAFGFSTVIFAPLVKTLILIFDLTSTFRILAVVFFVAVVALFRWIKLPPEDAPPSSQTGSTAVAQRQYTTTEIIRTRTFYMIAVSLMFGTSAYFVLNPSFVTLAIDRDLVDFSTMIVMMTGIANSAGRLLVPLLSDRITREGAAFCTLFVTAICSICLIFATGFLFILAIFFNAFCYGGYSGIYPVMTSDYFGVKNVGSNYGAIMVGWAICALLMPMIISAVPSLTLKFIILASLSLIGAALILILRSGKKKLALS
jgi:OFA family oxalate/formate antiporter-like MFS transporter